MIVGTLSLWNHVWEQEGMGGNIWDSGIVSVSVARVPRLNNNCASRDRRLAVTGFGEPCWGSATSGHRQQKGYKSLLAKREGWKGLRWVMWARRGRVVRF